MGVSFAGVQLTGGLDKPFYVKHKGAVVRLKKKNYGSAFGALFESCPALMAKYGKSLAWRDFCCHVFMLNQECGGLASK